VRELAQDDFLKKVIATSKARSKPLKAGDILWRAQLGHCWREEKEGSESVKVPTAYSAKRMKPIPEKAVDGRVNPKGIVCLYLATNKKTVVLETRPLIGSYISVAQFKVLRDVQLVDCSADKFSRHGRVGDLGKPWKNKLWSPQDIEKAVWSDINRAFSKPADRGDDSLDYVPTQILAETFKREGFGGIAYKSSYGKEGVNIALFDIGGADPINYSLYSIDDVLVTKTQHEEGVYTNFP
jgi:hypothetical protein